MLILVMKPITVPRKAPCSSTQKVEGGALGPTAPNGSRPAAPAPPSMPRATAPADALPAHIKSFGAHLHGARCALRQALHPRRLRRDPFIESVLYPLRVFFEFGQLQLQAVHCCAQADVFSAV